MASQRGCALVLFASVEVPYLTHNQDLAISHAEGVLRPRQRAYVNPKKYLLPPEPHDMRKQHKEVSQHVMYDLLAFIDLSSFYHGQLHVLQVQGCNVHCK